MRGYEFLHWRVLFVNNLSDCLVFPDQVSLAVGLRREENRTLWAFVRLGSCVCQDMSSQWTTPGKLARTVWTSDWVRRVCISTSSRRSFRRPWFFGHERILKWRWRRFVVGFLIYAIAVGFFFFCILALIAFGCWIVCIFWTECILGLEDMVQCIC